MSGLYYQPYRLRDVCCQNSLQIGRPLLFLNRFSFTQKREQTFAGLIKPFINIARPIQKAGSMSTMGFVEVSRGFRTVQELQGFLYRDSGVFRDRQGFKPQRIVGSSRAKLGCLLVLNDVTTSSFYVQVNRVLPRSRAH